jgi:hypothetical protein
MTGGGTLKCFDAIVVALSWLASEHLNLMTRLAMSGMSWISWNGAVLPMRQTSCTSSVTVLLYLTRSNIAPHTPQKRNNQSGIPRASRSLIQLARETAFPPPLDATSLSTWLAPRP